MVETLKMALGCKWMLVEPRAGPGFKADPKRQAETSEPS